jgi:hypothetical protein
MNNYKKHKLQLFIGIYQDIPSAVNFNPNAIASNSIRYFGFLVGHITCGFLTLFHFIFFFLIAIRIISSRIHYNPLVFTIIIPAFVAYLLTTVGISTAAKFLFIQDISRFNLKNGKMYAIFVYWTFFAGKIYLPEEISNIQSKNFVFIKIVFLVLFHVSFV